VTARKVSTMARVTPSGNGLPWRPYTYRGGARNGSWRPGERPCPVCGAPPGEPCTGLRGAGKGQPAGRWHRGRGVPA
jgi:hypothetical protein